MIPLIDNDARRYECNINQIFRGASAILAVFRLNHLVFQDQKRGIRSQLLGAGCLIVVILTHIAEALQLFPFMHWGQVHSIGHYLDLTSVILGITLFPLGYLLHARGIRRAR